MSVRELEPAGCRDLGKEEVLESIAKGYKAALAGDHIAFEELMAELNDEHVNEPRQVRRLPRAIRRRARIHYTSASPLFQYLRNRTWTHN